MMMGANNLRNNSFGKIAEFNFENYELVGDLQCSVAIDGKYSDELAMKVIAAVKAYTLDCKSIDYVYRNYIRESYHKPIIDNKSQTLRDIFSYSKREIRKINNRLHNETNSIDQLGMIVAKGALIRLKNSFEASLFMIRQQYYYEAMSIFKLITEQLAWSFEIYKLNEDKIMKTKPSYSINKLKDVIPNIGIYYGMLNEYAHIAAKVTPNHIKIGNDESKIILGNPNDTFYAAITLLEVLDFYGIVFEFIFQDYLNRFKYLIKSNETNCLILNNNRNSLNMIKMVKLRIEELNL